ncbi:heat-shock protein [Sphingobacteriaceae bacterium]|nr:heat-shock protein [Sphingobacteriaceae bacterium]
MNEIISPYHQNKEQIEQEQVLIAAAKKNSSRFAGLYKKYYEQIFLFILKRVESEDTAADVTSQVFLKALTNLSKYKDMGFPFSSWLFRIARNEIYDMYRDKKIDLVVSIEKKGVGEMIAEMGTEDKEDHSKLYLALGHLDESEMELIELRFFEKRHFKEIGEILEITENNAKVRTYRVLDKLKKLLKNER